MKPDFSPVIWPEAEAPSGILNCQKCELHRQRSRGIWGEGNPTRLIYQMSYLPSNFLIVSVLIS